MKYEVDMVRAVAYLYGHDITKEEAKRATLVIAGLGAGNEFAKEGSKAVGAKAAVAMVRKYLKGGVLKFIKELFKKLGLRFTRKALEKAIPFGVGVALGYGFNHFFTNRVGDFAIEYFETEAKTPVGAEQDEPLDGTWIFEDAAADNASPV
jgi:uncharacterized protein (DUF697 family)